MKFLERLLRRKNAEDKTSFEIDTPKGVLRLSLEDFFERDPDARIEEFWLEVIEVSEDGYWVVVGRRHGIVQLYDWSGKLHRLPSRPPAQVITDAVFRGKYLALLAPPYLVVYLLEDPKEPQTWQSFRTTQEGLRASAGLDIKDRLLAYGVVGERVYVIDISGGFNSQGLEFKANFSYSEAGIGELKVLRFLGNNRLLLSGTRGVALYDLGGNLLKRLEHSAGKAIALTRAGVVLAEGQNLLLYDGELKEVVRTLEVPLKVSHLDVSPDGDFLFVADGEENKMGIVYLPSFEHTHTLEGLGYSLVRVSPDGSVYTCSYSQVEDKRLYHLRALTSNIEDFLYGQDRKRALLKKAQEHLEAIRSKLKKAPMDVEELKEYKELLLMDAPIRELRGIVLRAKELIQKAKLSAFIREVEHAMERGSLDGNVLKEIDTRIRLGTQEEAELLQNLKAKVEEYFKRLVEENLLNVAKAVRLAQAKDMMELEALKEVKDFREFTERLPSDLRLSAQKRLTFLLEEKLVKERLLRNRIVVDGERVFFGSEDFPIFSGERRRLNWRIKAEDRLVIDGKVYTRIGFEREDGVFVEPKRYSNLLPEEALKHPPKWVKSYLRHLRGLFGYEAYRLPLFVSYEETPWFVQNLERFVRLVKEQLLYSEGIIILEGDAGVGKNFLVEVFSALTKRPLYIVPCNAKMEKEDITFAYEFDPKRGTKRVYSDLVRALQTPGAVIYFDEINTLPPSLIKVFNPLFDYRRYLYLSTGEVIKAHKDVVLVGAMNPQNYLGVSELPQDIKSRADIMFVNYPPFEEERGFYYPDEALILKDYVPSLSSLSQEEFVYLWYSVVNGMELVDKERKEKYEPYIVKLFELLKAANAIRKAYKDYQTQQSEEPVDFVFSIRDTIRCARRLERYASVKELLFETILPKVSSYLEREVLKSIIERTVL